MAPTLHAALLTLDSFPIPLSSHHISHSHHPPRFYCSIPVPGGGQQVFPRAYHFPPSSSASDREGRHTLRFKKLRVDVLPCRAASGGGSDGGDGGFGGSGGGGGGGDFGRGGGGDDGRSSGGSLLSWYMMALDKHPILTKSVTSAFLNLVGDLICQVLVNKVSVLDLKRLSVITFLGFALVGPALHFWYYALGKIVSLPGTSGTLLRLLLDQFIFSPTFIAAFICSLVTLEGKPEEVVPKLKQEWRSAVVANWQLWIPFQFLNFQFVPQQLQVLAANIVALAWNVILSFLAHKEVVTK